MHKAQWTNGRRVISGFWTYHWSSDTFAIELNSVDRITGMNRSFTIKGDHPEWGKWFLVGRSCPVFYL